MTWTSAQFVEHVRELAAAGLGVDERVDTIVLRGTFPSAQAQHVWIRCLPEVPAPFTSLQIYDLGFGGDLGTADDFDPDRVVSINIGKPLYEKCGCFIFRDFAANQFSTKTAPVRILVHGLQPSEAFAARALDVVPWDLSNDPGPAATLMPSIDPTRFVRDFVPEREVVQDLSPWILLTPPASRSSLFDAWEKVAVRRLLAGLVSRAWVEEGSVWLQASGPPIFRVRADDPILIDARGSLTQAVQWVFLSGADLEVRHLLFAGELARAVRRNQTFAATVDRALEAARAAYEAHVQSASRETLKILGDLRKTVIEETQKVAQRAQDLTSTLWRDVAVFALPFVLKILGDTGRVANVQIEAFFYFGAAAVICVSFVLQTLINRSFFASQRSSRQSWMQTLYSYISDRERQEIADAPIDQAMRSYNLTHRVLAVVYGVLILLLLAIGWHTLNQHRADPKNVPLTQDAPEKRIDQPASVQPDASQPQFPDAK